ncbi:ABC transporter permease [Paenibacillus macerans]|uniref:ABC transporter permease n=1 Tax=Paenibacillus macerans TaxID=44252 RepID=UPI000EC18A23|nr:ABC transporter permease [Paenibacillus macerans]GBK60676.1 ABC transporter permease [Paenibacillus macerans]GBK66976.1 ABC transporter permease [Paenibacillus macerans]GIP11364.1 ABC transporter permease [Paenibacillus macerans]
MDKLRKIFTMDSLIVPLVAILLGLLVGAVVMLIGGYNPLVAYGALIKRVVGNPYDFGETIRQITPLIFTGLAVAFAFRSGMFNIGADGQVLIGMTTATAVSLSLSGLPSAILVPLAVIAGGIAGGLWAAIAGYLKAKRGINEVITTIMLNWTALYLSNYVIRNFFLLKGQNRSEDIEASASMTFLFGMFNNARIHWGTVIALLTAVFFFVYLWKTKQGYEMRSVGLNPNAAEYAGMNVGRNVVKAMFISGVFAGLAGTFEVLGVFHYQSVYAASPGYGFDGIAVALLGMNHPFGVVLGAILYGVLTYGSAGMSFAAKVPPELIKIVLGSIIFFIAAQGIVRLVLKPFFLKRKKEKVL